MIQSTLKRLLRLSIRLLVKPVLRPVVPVGWQRRWTGLMSSLQRPPAAVAKEAVPLGGVGALRLRSAPPGRQPDELPAVLWAHGGNFILGGRACRGLAGQIAVTAAADVYLPDYRLAPEHPAPAPYDDMFSAYRALLDRGHRPERVAIGGDSAGAALAVATALSIGEMELPAPAALVLISPYLDLELSGATIATRASRDPLLRPGWLEMGALAHAGPLARNDPRINFLFADLSSLPPTLIQAGEDDILLDDAVRFADRAWAAGSEVELQRFPGLWHAFQLQAPMLRDAIEAIEDVGGFLRRRWTL